MALTNRTRLAKRKFEIQEVRKEKQTLTSKKHDKKCLEDSKSKDNLSLQLQVLEEKNNNLIKEQKENLLLINGLKTKIAAMEAEKKVESASIECQTEYEFQDIPCKDCIYVASCLEELNWHIENDHADEDEVNEFAIPSPFNCNICGKRNSNKCELRSH